MSFGSGILGTYSDRYGRKNSLIVSIILQVVFGPLTAFVPWFWTYMICRFFTGLSISAMASSAYTLLSEVTQNNMRKSLSASIDSTFSVGTFFLIGMAFLLSEWRYLQLALSCFVVPIVILIWYVLIVRIGFIFMTAILIIPEESKSTMMGFALIAKFCLSIIYTSKLVLIAKLFPSSVKNTAMGTCILFSEIGGLTAPYIVDILGSVAYWAPTTLYGILSLFAGILCLLIPRTKPQDKSDFDVNRCRQKTGSDKIFNEVYSTNM